MEISTYPPDSIVQKVIPGQMLGIIFSDGFEEAFRYFKGKDAIIPTTINGRMNFLFSISNRKDAMSYCYDSEEEEFGYLIMFDNGQLIVYMDDLSIHTGPSENGNQFHKLEYFDVISNNDHKALSKLMTKITAMLSYRLFWANDFFHVVAHAEEIEMCDPEESGYDETFIEQAKDFLLKHSYVSRKFVAADNVSIDKLERDLLREDIEAYLFYKKHKIMIDNFMENFRPWHFVSSTEEMDNGATNVNELMFGMSMINDEDNSFEDAEYESMFENADQNGASNMLSNIIITEESLVVSDKKKFLKDSHIFEEMKDFYLNIKHYMNETYKL